MMYLYDKSLSPRSIYDEEFDNELTEQWKYHSEFVGAKGDSVSLTLTYDGLKDQMASIRGIDLNYILGTLRFISGVKNPYGVVEFLPESEKKIVAHYYPTTEEERMTLEERLTRFATANGFSMEAMQSAFVQVVEPENFVKSISGVFIQFSPGKIDNVGVIVTPQGER